MAASSGTDKPIRQAKDKRSWGDTALCTLGSFLKMRLRCLVVTVLLWGPLTAHAAFESCPLFFAKPPPPIAFPAKQHSLCFDGFAVLYSGQSKTPVYVAERLNARVLASASLQRRTDTFYPEARLPVSARAQLSDYRGIGYSRGHMAPAANMADPASMAQSFSLANIVPQDRDHNRGAWAKVEKATRDYVRRAKGDVFVVTGPLFDRELTGKIGAGAVWVPERIFKLVYTPATGRAWVFVQSNSGAPQPMRPNSYRRFVDDTGLNLLSGLPVRD